jgi:hypothetical protein
MKQQFVKKILFFQEWIIPCIELEIKKERNEIAKKVWYLRVFGEIKHQAWHVIPAYMLQLHAS